MMFIDAYLAQVDGLANLFGTSHAVMHVHAGLAIYVIAQTVLRTRRGSLAALATVVVAAFGHEVLDFLGDPNWTAMDAISDILLTTGWPTGLTFASLYRRRRWRRYAAAAELLVAATGPSRR